MKYNTLRKPLIFPEYGRGIHEMILHTIAIEDRKSRNMAAQTIIKAMGIINPQVKDEDAYMHKLYDQMFIMSEYKLDIDAPYPMPAKETIKDKSKPIKYSDSNIRFKYYGKTLEAMIRKAAEYEDGEEKNALLNLISVQMKKSYYLWNNDNISEELIARHLDAISDGKICYTDEMKGEVYSQFYNKPNRDRKKTFINVSPYERTPTNGRRPINNKFKTTSSAVDRNKKVVRDKKRRA